MQRFAIYHKSKKFRPTTNQVIYTFNIAVIIIWIVLEKIIKTDQYSRLLGCAVAISLGIALLMMFIGKVKPPPLRGKLEGYISFQNDKIMVENEVFNLDDIKRIKITNDDYYGKIKYLERSSFNASFSNGTDNELLVELNTSQIKRYNFEIYNSADFQKIRLELINYHLRGKLEFSILINLLGLEKKDEIIDFKDYCQRQQQNLTGNN